MMVAYGNDQPMNNDKTKESSRPKKTPEREHNAPANNNALDAKSVADAERFARESDAIELFRVLQDGLEAAFLYVSANPLDDLAGRQRLAKDFLGQFATSRRDDIGLRIELMTQGRQLTRGIRFTATNPSYPQRFHRLFLFRIRLHYTIRRRRLQGRGPSPKARDS